MTITLITGANKGLGYESARRLIDVGHTVYLGARDAERGQRAADELGARFVQLDVTDDASVTAAADLIRAEEGRLDLLINNAGIAGGFTPAAELTADHVAHVFETNVFGLVRVTHAMEPLLEVSDDPAIINVASGLGSFGIVTDPNRMESRYPTLAYSASKAAVLMLTVQYAKALPGIRINTVDPGYTGTDLNANNGTQTVQEGTDAIVEVASFGPGSPTGTFRSRAGIEPW